MEWPLLADLPRRRRPAALCDRARRTFARGEVVFHRDDPADSLHLVVARTVRRAGADTARRQRPRRRPRAGSERSASSPAPADSRRSATVEALEAGETRSVFRDDFALLQREHPGVKDVLLRLLAEQLRRSTERVVEAHYVDAETRGAASSRRAGRDVRGRRRAR
jgi:CRP-like cAMP-binding protein